MCLFHHFNWTKQKSFHAPTSWTQKKKVLMYPSNKILLTKTLKTHIRVYTYCRTPQNLQTHNPKLFSENKPNSIQAVALPRALLLLCSGMCCCVVAMVCVMELQKTKKFSFLCLHWKLTSHLCWSAIPDLWLIFGVKEPTTKFWRLGFVSLKIWWM